MHTSPPGSWSGRVLRASLTLLALAVGARVVYELLAPLMPLVLALLVLGTAYLATTQRWRH